MARAHPLLVKITGKSYQHLEQNMNVYNVQPQKHPKGIHVYTLYISIYRIYLPGPSRGVLAEGPLAV